MLGCKRCLSSDPSSAKYNYVPRRPAYGAAVLATAFVGVSVWYHNEKRIQNVLHADGPISKHASNTREVIVLDEQEKQGATSSNERPSKDRSILPSLPDWSSITSRITDAVLPSWAKLIPGYYDKLTTELSQAPGSLADEIWREAHDPTINSEIVRNATVRISDELCDEEKAFLDKRKLHTRRALAKYLDVSESEIHPDDVPTIAMCGSGGGLRALVAGTSSYLSAQEAGLFDIVTYTAGVSGSCWLQSLYYSSITGQRHDRLIEHLKLRLNVHIAFPPPLLQMLTTAPTMKYLLSGGFEKYKGVKDADFGLVDVYGVLLGARLLVPDNELSVDDRDLKISNQRRFVNDGQHPLPIYTAVRHEIPREVIKAELKQQEEEAAATATSNDTADKSGPLIRPRPQSPSHRPDFQWLEFTPYEFWCEDFGAGIPTWSIGRQFEGGRTVWRDDSMCLPELRLPLLMGIFGSAFCATLSHYYKEIRPLVKGLPGLGVLDDTLTEKDEDLIKIHPVSPAQVPNFAVGMRGRLPDTCPESVHDAPSIQLMDAGMSNNLPIYPLLRPGREVDILVAFDASADVRKDNWLKVAEGYSKQRGYDRWPAGCGWPSPQTDPDDERHPDFAKDAEDDRARKNETLNTNEPSSPSPPLSEGDKEKPQNGNKESSPSQSDPSEGTDLGYCTVWIGDAATPDKVYSTTSSSSPHDAQHPPSTTARFTLRSSSSENQEAASGHDSSQRDDKKPPQNTDTTNHNPLHSPTAGLAVIYFPLIPNPSVPAINPQTSDFMSTWNFVYTPEQVDDVVSLARANFKEGEELVKEVVRGVWERKKARRLGGGRKGGVDGGRDGVM